MWMAGDNKVRRPPPVDTRLLQMPKSRRDPGMAATGGAENDLPSYCSRHSFLLVHSKLSRAFVLASLQLTKDSFLE